MNTRVKFLELVLSDLVSERDTLEMDLNFVLNNNEKKTKDRKKEFNKVLEEIVVTNNKIKTLSEYMTTLTSPIVFKENTQDSE
tara:strand:+ start:1300 stop:1548 length:249 start_codon:yes stop_codon:yes gene_type:complete